MFVLYQIASCSLFAYHVYIVIMFVYNSIIATWIYLALINIIVCVCVCVCVRMHVCVCVCVCVSNLW